jgi:hypothetical protein
MGLFINSEYIITKIDNALKDKLELNDIVTGHYMSNYDNTISLTENLNTNKELLKIKLVLKRCND